MDNDSQCKLILFYLKEYGKITAKDAMQLCGCMRLAARIHDLRKKESPSSQNLTHTEIPPEIKCGMQFIVWRLTMLNHITIMGRLTRDPELRRTGSGVAVASFTVAVDRDFGNNGEKETDFIDCVAWRQTGEFVSKYFTKGSMIIVSGRLQIRSWNDKDGNKRRTAEVVADNCYFGESKKYDIAPSGGFQTQSQDFARLDDDDAQLPF